MKIIIIAAVIHLFIIASTGTKTVVYVNKNVGVQENLKDTPDHAEEVIGNDGAQVPITTLIREAFPDNADTMVAIAQAESSLNPKAEHRNKNGSVDACLFQINSIHGYDKEWLKEPKNCIEAAKKIYAKQGLKAWAASEWKWGKVVHIE